LKVLEEISTYKWREFDLVAASIQRRDAENAETIAEKAGQGITRDPG
jgi:hypothetical protein